MHSDKNSIAALFPLPSTVVKSSGIGFGIIIRFKTFYLKLNDYRDAKYKIEGFRYNEDNPVFTEIIASFELRDFAAKFNREDYLLRFQEPCDDPNCILNQFYH